ncbi:MAG: TIGR02996 domain-containing protein [Polyangiales bacterium]
MDEELLRDVIEAPDDDGPRLVYADWLLEHGDESQRARGEYIQLACAIAKLPDQPTEERARLVRRSMELLGKWELAWVDVALAPLFRRRVWDARGVDWAWSRGFIEGYGENPDSFRPAVSHYELARMQSLATPLREVSVHVDAEGMTQFIGLPLLRRLRALDLHVSHTGGDCFAPFADSDALASLRSLRLVVDSSLHLGPILAAPLPNLERLGIWLSESSAVPIGWFESLAKSPLAKTVTSLELHCNQWGDANFDRMMELPYPLTSLSVRSNDAGRMLDRLASQPHRHASVRSLSVRCHFGRDVPWSVDGAMALLAARPALESLRFEDAYPAPDLTRLFAMPEFTQIRSLRLAHNFLEDEAALTLARAEHVANLRELDLSYCRITNEGGKAVATAKNLRHLRRLNLRSNARIGVAAFTKTKSFADLEHLDLRDNSIPEKGSALLKLRERFGAAAIAAYDPDT